MLSLYNRVAGQSVERLVALGDGIFVSAMTLRLRARDSGLRSQVSLPSLKRVFLVQLLHRRAAGGLEALGLVH